MNYLKSYYMFENFSEDDILEEFKLWDIDYHYDKKNNFLEIYFKFPDRINNYEIDTINKVLYKLDNVRIVRILSGDKHDKMFLNDELFNLLKIPNNMKIITGNYKLITQSFPEIKEYYKELLKNIETKKFKNYPDSIFYIKNGEIIMEQELNTKRVYCKYEKFWKFLEEFSNLHVAELTYMEISKIISGLVEDFFNLKDYVCINMYYTYSCKWRNIII